jgi:SAM-dependent methyltransferase
VKTQVSVRDFYERLPYPPPVDRLGGQRDGYANQLRRRAWFHRMWPGRPLEVNQKILIAGCGTAQGARYALRHPEAHVTAIDVSETSLRHTLQLQRTYHLDNLDVHRLALEDVKQLGCAFDAIVCTGVLHHLAAPDVGLRALRDVLEPGGAIHLMVYAPYGRAVIYMMSIVECSALARRLTSCELHALLDALPREHASWVSRHAKDFQEPYAMADALLHPMDRAYAVPELYAWLARCGLSFGRWVEQAPYLAQCGLVAESPHSARLAALPPRLQHAAIELFRGTMVSHSLIAYRDDCLSCRSQSM